MDDEKKMKREASGWENQSKTPVSREKKTYGKTNIKNE
jgi:hypothetical protein